ncbi:choline kinase [Sphingomonas faeni]|nr:choline kinase [Sphingomonas faeni]
MLSNPDVPMRAIILSAGRGSRLGDITRDRPKCLLEFAGRTLLDWQIDALNAAGIEDIVVIVGFGAKRVIRAIEARSSVRVMYNPFFQVADNLASLWLAREEMDRDFLILNGDTLVSPDIVATAIREGRAPVNVTITHKTSYDADDMKVTLDGDIVTAVGKRLAVDRTHAESIGLLTFRGCGPTMFRQAVELALADPSGVENWYLSVVDALARQIEVGTVVVDGMPSAEVDYPADLPIAEALAASWRAVLAKSA